MPLGLCAFHVDGREITGLLLKLSTQLPHIRIVLTVYSLKRETEEKAVTSAAIYLSRFVRWYDHAPSRLRKKSMLHLILGGAALQRGRAG